VAAGGLNVSLPPFDGKRRRSPPLASFPAREEEEEGGAAAERHRWRRRRRHVAVGGGVGGPVVEDSPRHFFSILYAAILIQGNDHFDSSKIAFIIIANYKYLKYKCFFL
jgi:hypothetical protein